MPILYRAPAPETVAAARARLNGLTRTRRRAGWVPAINEVDDVPGRRGGWVPGTGRDDLPPDPGAWPPFGHDETSDPWGEGEPRLTDPGAPSSAASSTTSDAVAHPDERTWRAGVEPPSDGRLIDRSLRDLLRSAVPASLRGARWVSSRRAVAAVSVLAVCAAVVVALAAWHARPEPVAIAPRPVAVHRTEPSPSPTPQVVVSVAGKVRSPGLVTLPAGSRVADAIRAAGGLRRGARIGLLNLARRLVDGEQVVVGIPGAVSAPVAGTSSAGSGASGAGPTSLNTATEAELETLPGVGPVLAQRIIDYRTAHGGFRSVDQLRDVSGIGPKKFADLQPVVTP